jgi:hypothetical protein
MPQHLPPPRHPDDTPDSTPIIDIDAARTAIVHLEPANDRHGSPLRRALRAAFSIRPARSDKED